MTLIKGRNKMKGLVLAAGTALLLLALSSLARAAPPWDPLETFAASLTRELAQAYYDTERRTVIHVAVLDFTNQGGLLTEGSRSLAEQIRWALARCPQFEIVPPSSFEQNYVITPEDFRGNALLRERVATDLQAHVYILGEVSDADSSMFSCKVSAWGRKRPGKDPLDLEPLVLEEDTAHWNPGLTDSGLRLFRRPIARARWTAQVHAKKTSLAEVVFLTQPMCDDLNPYWEIRADGMVYDRRKDRYKGSLRDRTGQVMQSRIKGVDTLKAMSYVIRGFGLVVQLQGGTVQNLESYMIPRSSRYYYLPLQAKGENGLRFEYLWAEPGKSARPAGSDVGMGWKLFLAQDDWTVKMPMGVHTATATLEPMAESSYGTKIPKAEYVKRYRFYVGPGLNVYVVNYVYRRDRPEIFVRRLEVEEALNVYEGKRSIKSVKEIYRVYGAEKER